MKAVIVELDGNHAVALCSNGQFEKIRNKSYEIGQEIQMPAQTIRFPKQTAVAACAALAITACGGLGSYTWSNPISYVSLDINPSIAYSLNEFNRVISIDGMNEEGMAIADEIGDSVKNADITTALTITVEQLSTDAYIDSENTNYMIIGVYSDKDKKADALLSTVDEFTASTTDTCSITTVNVSKETKETADSYGITAGKMELINEIANVASDPTEVDPAALKDLTVAELEQTKAAATTGVSVSEAVAAATPDKDAAADGETPADAPAADPNAVASDTKPEETTDTSSSAKKDDANTTPADNAAAVTSDSISAPSEPQTPAAADTKPAADTPSASDHHATSTDKNGNGSSEKKDPPAGESPAKGETTSSEKKDESSSSEKKDNTTSSEKKDAVTEDDSQQTNTAPAEESADEPNSDVSLPEMSDMIIASNIQI